jgi:hypothetical protein
MKTIGTIIISLFITLNFALAQETLYIYKEGTVIYEQVVSNIDSITFKKSNTNNITDNAPDKIIGNAIVLFNPQMQYTLRASSFTSNNTCTVPMLLPDFILTATPTYTYSKSAENVASLVVKYSDKFQMIGSNYTYSNYTYTAALSFTSESGGTYTGTEKVITTGDYPDLNGTASRDIYGTFTMY